MTTLMVNEQTTPQDSNRMKMFSISEIQENKYW